MVERKRTSKSTLNFTSKEIIGFHFFREVKPLNLPMKSFELKKSHLKGPHYLKKHFTEALKQAVTR